MEEGLGGGGGRSKRGSFNKKYKFVDSCNSLESDVLVGLKLSLQILYTKMVQTCTLSAVISARDMNLLLDKTIHFVRIGGKPNEHSSRNINISTSGSFV